MPPRYAYWTIILDGSPTSFRTKEREEILPLFNQLRAKNPAAMLKWFSGGRLWDSPEQAKEIRDVEKVRRFREERSKQMKTEWSPGSSDPASPKAHREGAEDPLAEFRRQHGRPADGSDQKSPAARWSPGSLDPGSPKAHRDRPWSPKSLDPASPRRGKDWRPGGEHRDPRDKYKLPPGEARKRWKDRHLGPRGPKPFGPNPSGGKPGGDRPYGDRPRGPTPFGSKPGGPRPFGKKPFGGPPSGPPSTHRQAQGRPEQGRGATRHGHQRSLRPGKPPGGPRRKG